MYSKVFKYNPNHDELGRFAEADYRGVRVNKDHLREVYKEVSKPDGGFTYQPVVDTSPTKGFAVSPYPERSFAEHISKFKFRDLVDYVIKNKDMFIKSNHYLGGWHDPASGKVFLDISIVTNSREKAHQLCLANDQIAYFDLEKFESVTVNKDAKSGGVA